MHKWARHLPEALHPGSLPPPKHTPKETDIHDINHWAPSNSGCPLHLAFGKHWPETGRKEEIKGVLFISLLLPCQVPMNWLYSGHKARSHHNSFPHGLFWVLITIPFCRPLNSEEVKPPGTAQSPLSDSVNHPCIFLKIFILYWGKSD